MHELLPLAISFDFFNGADFWVGVGVLAGIYTVLTLGLQLNVGFTGIQNFGQIGFAAIGAYVMALLVSDADWSFWLAIPVAIGFAVCVAVVLGVITLRLRADFFAIATIAFSEIVRYIAQNARGLTHGNQGVQDYVATWRSFSRDFRHDVLDGIGMGGVEFNQMPLLIVTWIAALLLLLLLRHLTTSPWGRVLRAIREDEDAARAMGKNTLRFKLQSLGIAAAVGAFAGILLALQTPNVAPDNYLPLYTFIGYAVLILGGLTSWWGVAVGALIVQFVLEATRLIDFGLSESQTSSMRFIIVGLVIILLVAFRPQGVFGKREEMVLGD